MDFKEIRSNKLAQPVTCVIFTWKVPGFNLGWDTLYLKLLLFSFISPNIC